MTRMTMKDVVEVCEELGISPTASPHGVQVGTTGWRIESGGGIAGNGDKWWLQPIARMYDPDSPDGNARAIGPARTRAQLAAILGAKWKTQTLNAVPSWSASGSALREGQAGQGPESESDPSTRPHGGRETDPTTPPESGPTSKE